MFGIGYCHASIMEINFGYYIIHFGYSIIYTFGYIMYIICHIHSSMGSMKQVLVYLAVRIAPVPFLESFSNILEQRSLPPFEPKPMTTL